MQKRNLAPLWGVGLAVGICCLVLLLASGAGTKRALALTNCTTTEDGLSAAEQQMIQLYNQHRASIGKPAFKVSPALNRAAAWMANDQATKVGLSHTDSLGRDAFTRGADCGVQRMTAENAAVGSSNASTIFSMWLESSGHRAAIEGNYLMVGMGEKNGFWTADFGNFDDSTTGGTTGGATGGSSPSPTPTFTPTRTPTPAPTATPSPIPTNLARVRMDLPSGTSLLTYVGTVSSPAAALASLGGALVDVYHWDAATGDWQRYGPGAPSFAQTLSAMVAGEAYFVRLREPAVWAY